MYVLWLFSSVLTFKWQIFLQQNISCKVLRSSTWCSWMLGHGSMSLTVQLFFTSRKLHSSFARGQVLPGQPSVHRKLRLPTPACEWCAAAHQQHSNTPQQHILYTSNFLPPPIRRESSFTKDWLWQPMLETSFICCTPVEVTALEFGDQIRRQMQ